MDKLKLVKVRCSKCGYEWVPRVPDPRSCPKCGSLRWDTQKKTDGCRDF